MAAQYLMPAARDDMKIRGWIYRITRNTIIDYLRKRKVIFKKLDAIDEVEHGFNDSPAQEIDLGLEKMVEALPEKYAHALLFTEFQGHTQKDLADRIGLSIPAAKSRVQRARDIIKDSLMTAVIGWNLSVWRLVSTLVISLSAGLITQFMIHQKWIDEKNILRTYKGPFLQKLRDLTRPAFIRIMHNLKIMKKGMADLLAVKSRIAFNSGTVSEIACCVARTSVDDNRVISGSASFAASTDGCGCDPRSGTFLERL